jgi:hypothetical protein
MTALVVQRRPLFYQLMRSICLRSRFLKTLLDILPAFSQWHTVTRQHQQSFLPDPQWLVPLSQRTTSYNTRHCDTSAIYVANILTKIMRSSSVNNCTLIRKNDLSIALTRTSSIAETDDLCDAVGCTNVFCKIRYEFRLVMKNSINTSFFPLNRNVGTQ